MSVDNKRFLAEYSLLYRFWIAVAVLMLALAACGVDSSAEQTAASMSSDVPISLVDAAGAPIDLQLTLQPDPQGNYLDQETGTIYSPYAVEEEPFLANQAAIASFIAANPSAKLYKFDSAASLQNALQQMPEAIPIYSGAGMLAGLVGPVGYLGSIGGIQALIEGPMIMPYIAVAPTIEPLQGIPLVAPPIPTAAPNQPPIEVPHTEGITTSVVGQSQPVEGIDVGKGAEYVQTTTFTISEQTLALTDNMPPEYVDKFGGLFREINAFVIDNKHLVGLEAYKHPTFKEFFINQPSEEDRTALYEQFIREMNDPDKVTRENANTELIQQLSRVCTQLKDRIDKGVATPDEIMLYEYFLVSNRYSFTGRELASNLLAYLRGAQMVTAEGAQIDWDNPAWHALLTHLSQQYALAQDLKPQLEWVAAQSDPTIVHSPQWQKSKAALDALKNPEISFPDWLQIVDGQGPWFQNLR